MQRVMTGETVPAEEDFAGGAVGSEVLLMYVAGINVDLSDWGQGVREHFIF